MSSTGLRVIVTVTFNDNQLFAHLLPIVRSPAVEEVVLIADKRPSRPIEKVRVVVPNAILRRLTGRALSKTVTCAVVAVRARPHWVIGLNLVPHGLNALVAARLSGAGAIYHQIGGPREWVGGGWDSDNSVLGRLHRPSRMLERVLVWLLRGFDRIAVMGHGGSAALVAQGCSPESIVIMPAALNCEAIDHARRTAEKDFELVCVGELIPVKRTRDALEAVHLLRERYGASVRLAIAGDGPLRRELEELARRLEISDLVKFLGFRTDVHVVINSATVFVLPSAYEGLSISLLDAMASGLGVVAADVGEVRDVVDDGVSGLLYTSGNVGELVEALRLLLTDSSRRASIGRHARAAALAKAAMPALQERWTAVLLGGSRSRHAAVSQREASAPLGS